MALFHLANELIEDCGTIGWVLPALYDPSNAFHVDLDHESFCRACRSLLVRYHPDRTGNDPADAAIFHRVQALLERWENYDRFLTAYSEIRHEATKPLKQRLESGIRAIRDRAEFEEVEPKIDSLRLEIVQLQQESQTVAAKILQNARDAVRSVNEEPVSENTKTTPENNAS